MESNPVFKVILLMTLALQLSCASPRVGKEEDKVITMEKTECYGTCPVYLLEIYENGTVTLDARRFMDMEGMHFAKLSKEDLNQLIARFVEADFFAFEDSYDSEVSDLPTTYIRFRWEGKSKKIKDYVGAPDSLKQLESLIHALVGELEWRKVDSKE